MRLRTYHGDVLIDVAFSERSASQKAETVAENSHLVSESSSPEAKILGKMRALSSTHAAGAPCRLPWSGRGPEMAATSGSSLKTPSPRALHANSVLMSNLTEIRVRRVKISRKFNSFTSGFPRLNLRGASFNHYWRWRVCNSLRLARRRRNRRPLPSGNTGSLALSSAVSWLMMRRTRGQLNLTRGIRWTTISSRTTSKTPLHWVSWRNCS